jgi:hypothetical protein
MVSITWNRMQFMDWYQLHGIGCNWRTSSNSIISFTIELESKNNWRTYTCLSERALLSLASPKNNNPLASFKRNKTTILILPQSKPTPNNCHHEYK